MTPEPRPTLPHDGWKDGHHDDTIDPGIHHITAIAGDVQRNLAFYA